MMLAHSANAKKGVPVQDYAAHVVGVLSRSGEAAQNAARYSATNGDLLREVVRLAAEFHDLGKLDAENQKVLAGIIKARHLPIQHTDAGTAHILDNIGNSLSAVLAKSHHIGLPDFIEEKKRCDESVLRDDSVREHVNGTLLQLLKDHEAALESIRSGKNPIGELSGSPSLFFRIALSCLADGDHSDTSSHYGEYPTAENKIDLKPIARLALLDRYVQGLGKDNDIRSQLRSEMYDACRNAVPNAGISSCDSPVGTGKTTAIMAHLLAQADRKGLRRIIVVLPFTNIITQSVETYRKALVLPGENPEDVVGELHHRAEFQNMGSRHLTALWKAPIIVTTAVTFFETLASNTPSTLRRLHNLPGSAVFVDESHAALPAKLLPLAWQWMKSFSREWQCYWVLASGSLNRFWQIPEFDDDPPCVPEIITDRIREQLMQFENERIIYRYKPEPLDVEEFVGWVASLPGPRIVILNTVQSAAVIAQAYAEKYGRECVAHISTALTPRDRSDVLKDVRSRLLAKAWGNDEDWTLIATSCVEAGVDFSFRTGIREIGSLVSLLQTAGRVKRHGGDHESEVWSIRLTTNGLLKSHPGMKESAQVLREYCERKILICPALCTKALKREIRLAGECFGELRDNENQMRFPIVEKKFRVINTDTRLVVVDKQLINRLEQYQPVNWKEIQQGSVQIWGYRLEALKVQEIRDGIYKWNYPYNDLLGYMAGILPVIATDQIGFAII